MIMATTKPVFSHGLVIGSLFLLGFSLQLSLAQDLKSCGFDAMYVFGDSLSDTGNAIFLQLPFGMSLHGIGLRSSDGLLLVDYFAKSAGIPLVEAYKNSNAIRKSGVDFAASGVGALSADFRVKNGMNEGYNPDDFGKQVQNLEAYLKGFCIDSQDCPTKLKSSFFVVWIGLNDYNYAFNIGEPPKTIDQVKQMNLVGSVVEAIVNGVEKIIGYGATKVLVLGIPQYGCAASFLTPQSTANISAVYDQNGCLKDYNDFLAYHNAQLQTALETLGKKHPNVRIVYGDTYKAMQRLLDERQKLGFESLTGTCCGTGGKYNFTGRRVCAADHSLKCSAPDKYVFFDGIHFTQKANEILAGFMIEDILSKLQCSA